MTLTTMPMLKIFMKIITVILTPSMTPNCILTSTIKGEMCMNGNKRSTLKAAFAVFFILFIAGSCVLIYKIERPKLSQEKCDEVIAQLEKLCRESGINDAEIRVDPESADREFPLAHYIRLDSPSLAAHEGPEIVDLIQKAEEIVDDSDVTDSILNNPINSCFLVLKVTSHGDLYTVEGRKLYKNYGQYAIYDPMVEEAANIDGGEHFIITTTQQYNNFYWRKSSSKKSTRRDYYGAADYVDPEDFYDDYYDDFDCFEDAELYWEEYQ